MRLSSSGKTRMLTNCVMTKFVENPPNDFNTWQSSKQTSVVVPGIGNIPPVNPIAAERANPGASIPDRSADCTGCKTLRFHHPQQQLHRFRWLLSEVVIEMISGLVSAVCPILFRFCIVLSGKCVFSCASNGGRCFLHWHGTTRFCLVGLAIIF